jgi:hypothetical protein
MAATRSPSPGSSQHDLIVALHTEQVRRVLAQTARLIVHLARGPYSLTMIAPSDLEDRYLQLVATLMRRDLEPHQQLAQLREIVLAPDPQSEVSHDWREVSSEPLPGSATSDSESPEGHSVQYRCHRCGARGHRLVFSAGVTLYPIISEIPSCRRHQP